MSDTERRPVVNTVADTPPDPYPGEFLRVVAGSTAHGLSIAGTDDLDLLGVCVETPRQMLDFGSTFEQYVYRTSGDNHTPSGPGDIDLTCYGLGKFMRLMSAGNPTLINMLFVPPEHRTIDAQPFADELRGLIPSIVSRKSADRYIGYLRAQRERLLGERGGKHTGQDRKKFYVQADGDDEPWDGKYGMHMIRLGVQGVELLSTGTITLPMRPGLRDRVRGIRQGWYTKGSVIAWAKSLEEQLVGLKDASPLCSHPDYGLLNDWVRSVYKREWQW